MIVQYHHLQTGVQLNRDKMTVVRVDAAVVDYLRELAYCKKTRHYWTMILLSPSANQHALSCTPSTKDKILCATAVGSRRNLCVGFNSSHSGGHLLSGDRGEQLVVKATLSAISKLILDKRNYFFLRDCSTCIWQPAHGGPRHRGISQQSQFFHCEGKHLDTQGNKGTTCA